MKKLIALLFTLSVLLAGLLGFALAETADAAVPQIGDVTVEEITDDDGYTSQQISLSLSGGENVYSVKVNFTTEDGGWAGYAYLYDYDQDGVYTGTNNYYDSYPDGTISEYSMSSSKDTTDYSDDQQTQTYNYEYTSYTYNADRNLTNKNSNTEKTVSQYVEWTYGDNQETASNWVTTSRETEQEYLTYKDGEVTATDKTDEAYKVKAILPDDGSYISSFYGLGSSDYEILSASRVTTSKGTTESDYGDEKVITENDLVRTYAVKEDEYGYTSFVEDTVVGSTKETRKGEDEITTGGYDDDGNWTYTVTGKQAYTYETTTTYDEDGITRTVENKNKDSYYDLNNKKTSEETVTDTTVSEKTSWTYQPENGDGRECSGYATTSRKSDYKDVTYKDGKAASTNQTTEEYEVKLSDSFNSTYLYEFSGLGSSNYDVISASRVVTNKGTTENDEEYADGDKVHVTTEKDLKTTYKMVEEERENWNGETYINRYFEEDVKTGTEKETRKGMYNYYYNSTKTDTDETLLTTYGANKTRTVELNRNNKVYNKETNELERVETVDTKKAYQYVTVEYTREVNGEPQTYTTSGSALTSRSGSETIEYYENNKATQTNTKSYDETLQLKEGTTYIPSDYSSSYYEITDGTETVSEKYTEDITIGEYDENGNYVRKVTGKEVVDNTTTTSYDGEKKTRVVEKDNNRKEYDLKNKLTGAYSEKSSVTSEKQDVEYTDYNGEKQTVNGYVRTAMDKTLTDKTYKDGKLYYTSTDKTESSELKLNTDNVNGTYSLDYDSSYDIVTGTTTEIRKGSKDNTTSVYDEKTGEWKSVTYKYSDVDETTVTKINNNNRTATVKRDNKQYNTDGTLYREEKRDSEDKYTLTQYKYDRWNYNTGEYEKQTAYGYAATSSKGSDYTKYYYYDENGNVRSDNATTNVYDKTLALNEDIEYGSWHWTILDPNNSYYYTVTAGSETVTTDNGSVDSEGKKHRSLETDQKNYKDGDITDSTFDYKQKVDDTLTRHEAGDTRLEKDGNKETLTSESTIRYYDEEDGKQTRAEKKTTVTTDTYEEKEYTTKQDGEEVTETDRKLIASVSTTTTTRLNKDDKQEQVTETRDSRKYKNVEKPGEIWDSDKQEWVDDPENTYIARMTSARTYDTSTKQYSTATENLTSDDTSNTVYSYDKDGRGTGYTTKRTDKDYFNKVLTRDYKSESVTVTTYDENGYSNEETPESSYTDISYYKLTGHLKREETSETRTDKEKDKNGGITKTVSATTTETKNYIDENQSGEVKRTRTETTVYTNKDDAGRWEYYRDQESTTTTVTTGKNFNRYSGKLLSTYEEESESKAVRKDGSYTYPYSKTDSKTYDPEGVLIASSLTETKKETVEGDNGKTETTTTTTENFDKETGKASGERTVTDEYNANGWLVSSNSSNTEYLDGKMTASETEKTRYTMQDGVGISAYTYDFDRKTYDPKTGKELSNEKRTDVENYDEDGNRTDRTYTRKGTSADSQTFKTTYKWDTVSKYIYGQDENGFETRKESHSESNDTYYDSVTGKKTYSTSSKSDDTYTAGKRETGRTQTEKSYNKDTGAEVSGSITRESARYTGSNQLLESSNTYTATGKGGRTVSTSTTKVTHDYSEAGNEVSVVTTKDGKTYDRDTGSLEYTTHEEQAKDYVLNTDKTNYTKTNAAKIVVETRSEEKNIVTYDNDDAEKATTRTEKEITSEKRFDEATGKNEVYSRETENVWTYKKDKDGTYAYNGRTESATTKDDYGTSKIETVYGKPEVKTTEYSEKTGESRTTEKSLVTRTETSYDKNGSLKDRTVTTTETTGTRTDAYKAAEAEDEAPVWTGAVIEEKTVATVADDSTHITTVRTESTRTKESAEKGWEETVTASEETRNGVRFYSSTTTETASDTRKLGKDGKPEAEEAYTGSRTVRENYDYRSGTTKTENEYRRDYTWNKGTKEWEYAGTTTVDASYSDGRLISSSTTVEREKETVAKNELSKTNERTVETTFVNADQEKTVEKTTYTTQYKRAQAEDSFDRTVETTRQEKDGKTVSLSRSTWKNEENEEKNTSTSTRTDTSNKYYEFNGKARETHESTSVNVADNGEYSIGDYEIPTWDQGRSTSRTTSASTNYWKDQLVDEQKSESSNSYDFEKMTGQSVEKNSDTGYDNLTGEKTYTWENVRTTDYKYLADDFRNEANQYYWEDVATTETGSEKNYRNEKLVGERIWTEKETYEDKKGALERTETSTEYDLSGNVTGKTEETRVANKARSAYSSSIQTLDDTVTRKEWKNGILVKDEKDVTVNTYTDDSRVEKYTQSGSYYDENGGLTGKTEKVTTYNYDRTISTYGENFKQTNYEANEKQTNKAGNVIYAYDYKSENTEDEETGDGLNTVTSRTEYFDYLGNRTSGSSSKRESRTINSYSSGSQSITTAYSTESYNRFGVSRSTVYAYDEEGRQTGYTQTEYGAWNGKRYKATVTESRPEDRKDDYGNVKGTLTHTKTTNYDRAGAMTRQTTVDEAYDATYASTIRTTTTMDYVGKNELHQKKVEETVDGRKGYDSYYSRTTTVTDFENKQVSKYVYGYEKKDGKYLRSEATYEDSDTAVSENVYEEGVDKNGYWYSDEVYRTDGIVTATVTNRYDTKEKNYVWTRTDYDMDGKLIGKNTETDQYEADGTYSGEEKYYSKNKLVFTAKYSVPVGGTKSWVYTDGAGKEIGFRKTDAKGNESYKIPDFDYSAFELTGARTEYTETRDELGVVNSFQKKIFDTEARLDQTTVYRDKTLTDTWYRNPGNVKSRTVVKADAVTDDKGHVIETKRTETWFGLNGKQDSRTVTTTQYEYDEYSDEISGEYWDGDSYVTETYGKTRTVTTTEYRNSANALVVKETVVDDAFDDSKDSTTITKADGTQIGYSRTSADGLTYEELIPDYNPETGYVYSQKSTVIRTGEDGSKTRKEEQINKEGFVTSQTTDSIDKDRNRITTSKKWDDETKLLTYEQVQTTDGRTGNTAAETVNYRWQTGTQASSSRKETAYDSEAGLTTIHEEYFNAAGGKVYTVEGTRDSLDGNSGAVIWNLTWKDAAGNEIGHRKTDGKGAVTEKIPEVNSYNGELTGGWTESSYDLYNTVSAVKKYDKDGWLTNETIKTAEVSGKTTEYWPKSAQPRTVSEWSADRNGMTTSKETLYNLDGSRRKYSVTVSGRASGTHLETTKTSCYSGDNALVYTYERVNDLQKDEETVIYKDAKGKKIGYVERNDDGSYTSLTPSTGGRDGIITGFTREGTDENGLRFYENYDEKMNLMWGYRNSKDEDGNSVTSVYNHDATKPYEVHTSIKNGTKSTSYRLDGTQVAGTEHEWGKGDSIVKGITRYYGENGELTYSIMDINDASAAESYTVYLDKNGKEFARSRKEDSGKNVDTYLKKTYANVVTGWEETETSADGKVEIRRSYTADGEKNGESYKRYDTVYTDEASINTVTDQFGTVLSRTVTYKDEDGNRTKQYATVYSPYTGAVTGVDNTYYGEDSSQNFKHFAANGNMTYYGSRYSENDWRYQTATWANGVEKEYSWWDETDGTSSLYSGRNPNGTWSYWYYDYGNGNSEDWSYDSDGNLRSMAVTYKDQDGISVTNTTRYNRDGSISGYEWGRKSSGEFFGAMDYEVWTASALKYSVHGEEAADISGWVETQTDPSGNVRKITSNYDTGESSTTVTLANPTEGWNQAFGDQWYYVEDGKPVTGWKQLDGVYYAFDESGAMVNGVYDDGALWIMNANGAYVSSGWAQDSSGNWYYADENGQAATGWRYLGGRWYYFADGWYVDHGVYGNENNWKRGYAGNMVTGAARIWNSDWTKQDTWFFRADGSLDDTPGWKSDGIDYYYIEANGGYATGWRLIDGYWYYFDESGIMRNGWVNISGFWYYMNETGEMAADQWVQERFENDWYYADSSGYMQTGWQLIDGTWYFFNEDGRMAANQWVSSGSARYYMSESGAMTIGWKQIDGVWYYFDNSGMMATGTVVIDGTTYTFDASGAWQEEGQTEAEGGWTQTGGVWYYYNADGTPATGWLQNGTTWYYLNADGSMVTGWLDQGGSWYYFGADGRMVAGTSIDLGGTVYTFDSNGVWQPGAA